MSSSTTNTVTSTNPPDKVWIKLLPDAHYTALKGDIYTRACVLCLPPSTDELEMIVYQDHVCKVVLYGDNQCWLGRFTVVPHVHFHPMMFWVNEIAKHVTAIYVRFSKAIMKAFGAVTVQMVHAGALTCDHNGNPTEVQEYQHAYLEGIPRYTKTPVIEFYTKKMEFPDPQFKAGKFTALNIDSKAGLPLVILTPTAIREIIQSIRLGDESVFYANTAANPTTAESKKKELAHLKEEKDRPNKENDLLKERPSQIADAKVSLSTSGNACVSASGSSPTATVVDLKRFAATPSSIFKCMDGSTRPFTAKNTPGTTLTNPAFGGIPHLASFAYMCRFDVAGGDISKCDYQFLILQDKVPDNGWGVLVENSSVKRYEEIVRLFNRDAFKIKLSDDLQTYNLEFELHIKNSDGKEVAECVVLVLKALVPSYSHAQYSACMAFRSKHLADISDLKAAALDYSNICAASLAKWKSLLGTGVAPIDFKPPTASGYVRSDRSGRSKLLEVMDAAWTNSGTTD